MIRAGDSFSAALFAAPGRTERGRTNDVGLSAVFGDHWLADASQITSDLSPGVRGLSASQHASNVLAHLCVEPRG